MACRLRPPEVVALRATSIFAGENGHMSPCVRRSDFSSGAVQDSQETGAMRNYRIMALTLLVAIFGAVLATPVAASAQPAQGSGLDVVDLPVTLEDGTTGTFDGTLSGLDAALNEAGDGVVVSGLLEGVLTLADGSTVDVSQTFQDVATGLQAGDVCDILFLDLGPLFLDVLGLTVDLSQITLDINAVPGPGNLLGNLLCAVAGLLDGPTGTLNGVVALLDRIFSLLG